jgi:hypothetical protein
VRLLRSLLVHTRPETCGEIRGDVHA